MLARRFALTALTILTLCSTACDPEEGGPEQCPGATPVADAGPDQETGLQRVILNGRAVGDTVPRSFRWMFVSLPPGSQALLTGDTLVNPSFLPDKEGPYVVSLVVSDGCRESAPDMVTITVGNARPVARPGTDRTVFRGQQVVVDGSASYDPEGKPLTFEWTLLSRPEGSTATLSGASTSSVRFTPEVDGPYVLQLVVSDGALSSAPAMVTLTAGNHAPTASAGTSRTVPRRTVVTLDGSGSSDLDGDTLTYQWEFTVPAGSSAALSDRATPQPTFTADVEGAYVARLIVSDGRLSSPPASVTLTAVNTSPVASTSATVAAEQATELTLQGSGIDQDGDALTYAWSLLSRPSGSTAALSGANTTTPRFVPDLEGDYELSLMVSDGVHQSPAARSTVTAYRPVKPLAHGVIDAEYSKALDRIVMVGTSPNALYLYDPVAHTETSVALPAVPTSVSVSPDGKSAAVGHNANISQVSLSPAAQLVKTWPVTCEVGDVVLAGNGFAYAFPRVDQWVEIHSLNLSNGAETKSTGWSIRAGTLARLHPDGARMYGANNGLSPSDIERYSIATNGIAQMAWDSPYHGDYPMCGDLWFSEDGARIFTRCGRVFRAGATREQDMLYAGALSGSTNIAHLSESAAARRLALVPKPNFSDSPDVAMELRFYSSEFFDPLPGVTLPRFVRSGRGFKGYGRFVFFNAAGSKVFVLQQAEPGANMLNDFGVVTY